MTPTHPTVTELLLPLSEIDDRGVYFEDSFTSWRDHIRHGAAIAAALRERLDPARPPHVGVLLQNTPFFSATLVAGALSGIVPVGLNPVRRGAALAGDIAKADCQLVLTGSGSAEVRPMSSTSMSTPPNGPTRWPHTGIPRCVFDPRISQTFSC